MAISFDAFKQHWLNPEGQVIDYDHTYGYQCVDLIRQYFYECFDFPGGGGPNTAIQYWTNTPGDVENRFLRVPSTEPIKGDVVMLRTLGHTDYLGDGHICIATGSGDATNAEVIEQNGSTGSGNGVGGNAIRTRNIPKNRIAGLLRSKNLIIQPPIPYTIEAITPKQVQLIRTVHEWNLREMNVQEHPEGVFNEGTILTAVAICHHQVGFDYYLQDANDPIGFNVLDCNDYTPPPPKPPAAPVAVKQAQKVILVTGLSVYRTEEEARSRSNVAGSLPAGEYYLYEDKKIVQEIGLTNMTNDTRWYNVGDNIEPKPEPVIVQVIPKPSSEIQFPDPEKPLLPSEVPLGLPNDTRWQASYKSFFEDRRAVAYKTLNLVEMKEFTGKRPLVSIDSGKQVNIIGTFVKNGVVFYRPRANNDEYFAWYYGIPQTDDAGNANLVKLVTDQPKLYTLSYLFRLWSDDAKMYLKGKKIMDVFFRK